MNKYIFIVNPVSGSGQRKLVIEQIKNVCEAQNIDFEIQLTQHAGHATELAKEASKIENTVVCAVGGDGSLNEVARGLVGSNTPMGIIPEGSGNGLARHLRIPLKTIDAIKALLNGRIEPMDAGSLNNELFFVTCGIGFDAEVSYNFSKRSTRGIVGYVKESIKLFPLYKSKTYRVIANGISKDREAFTISVANASQYGNDAVIAKDASVADGLLDLCVIKKYPKVFGPQIGISMFMKNLHSSKFYRGLQSEKITIESLENQTQCNAQIDGEAIVVNYPINIEVKPQALNVVVPQHNL